MRPNADIAKMKSVAEKHAEQARATLGIATKAVATKGREARHYAKCGSTYVGTFVRAFFAK